MGRTGPSLGRSLDPDRAGARSPDHVRPLARRPTAFLARGDRPHRSPRNSDPQHRPGPPAGAVLFPATALRFRPLRSQLRRNRMQAGRCGML